MNQYRRGLVVLSLAAFVVTQLLAAPVIGVATTRGTMEVDNASVRGTANLSDGASVRTNATAGQLHLQNGIQATLGQNTSAKVFSSRIELRTGAGQVATRDGFNLDALGFRIAPATEKAVARVAYERSDRILVTAVDSALKVSRGGVLLARLDPGTTYFFEPAADQDNTAKSAGKTSGQNSGSGTAAKTGLSTAAKWGIAAGFAAGAGIGLGVGLTGDDASR